MSRARTLVTAAVMAATFGAGATSSSAAYSISGGSYTGTANSSLTFTVAGVYTAECLYGTYSGNATGSATTSFTPAYSGCTFFGFPATVSQSGQWRVTANNGPIGGAAYEGGFSIPSFTTTTIDVPIAGCTVTIDDFQSFSNAATFLNVSSKVILQVVASGVSYSASGCPFFSGIDGELDTQAIVIPGIAVSGP